MDGLQFISSIIGSLAWPLAALILGLVFKEQVKSLLAKIKHAKGAGLEFDFSEEVRKVAAEAVDVKAELPRFEASASASPPSALTYKRVDRDDRPAAAILTAWAAVENVLLEFIAKRGVFVAPDDTADVGAWITAIAREKVLPARIAGLARELYELRNKVAHTDLEPSETDAKKYVATAETIMHTVKYFTGEAEKGKTLVFGHDFKKPEE